MEKDKKRSSTILIIFLIGTIILIAKALQLQVIDEGFRNRASSMVVERYTQYPSRGLIYDRNRKLLVYNNPMYDLLVTVKRINPAMDTNRFCSLLNISKETFIKNLELLHSSSCQNANKHRQKRGTNIGGSKQYLNFLLYIFFYSIFFFARTIHRLELLYGISRRYGLRLLPGPEGYPNGLGRVSASPVRAGVFLFLDFSCSLLRFIPLS